MEFELNRTALSYQKLMLHTQVVREESMEMIVPDAYPDISSLLDTSGVCCLHTKELQEGSASLSGQIYCTMLYLPESDTGVQSLRAELPIQCSLEQEALTETCALLAVPAILSAEARAVNPRKILLRVTYGISVRIYRPETLLIPGGVLAEPGQVEERLEEAEGCFTIATPERRFQFRDQLNLTGTQPAIAEVLRVQGSAGAAEARLIGGKLVFKGDVLLRVLYRSVEGELFSADFSLPYSQIMDAPEEEAAFQIEVTLMNWSLGELAADGRSVAVEADLYACAEIQTQKRVPLLADAYSVHYDTRPEFTVYRFPQMAENTLHRETRRELLETGEQELTVLDLRCNLVQTEIEAKPEQVTCRATVQADLIGLDESGMLQHLSHRLTLERSIPVTGDVEPLLRCSLSEFTALPAASGIELRVGVTFFPLLLQHEDRLCVSALTADEHAPQEQTPRPSIVLRQMGAGESLWDIAKAYATTIHEIQMANEIETECVETGQLLLIPHRR